MRRDYAHDLREASARQEQVPAASYLLLLSGVLSVRAQQAKRSDLVLTLEGFDARMYHCQSTGRDLSSDAVAAACGLLAVAADEIAQAERAVATHECQCQKHDCSGRVDCAPASTGGFCESVTAHVCSGCERH